MFLLCCLLGLSWFNTLHLHSSSLNFCEGSSLCVDSFFFFFLHLDIELVQYHFLKRLIFLQCITLVCVLVTQLYPTFCDHPARLLCSWNSPGKDMECIAFLSPGDLVNLGTEPESPALQADSLPSELLGKPNLFVKD